MSNESHEWTLEGFVEHFDFVHHKMLDHKFVWVLGAGASLASGIPLGSTLVDDWLKDLHTREDAGKTPLSEWATAETLGIKDFKYEDRASFYPKVYEQRFKDYPEEGYAYLEDVMANADPSPGYSILAAALAGDAPRHNAVVTTNFDNLVADALSIYTDTFPFVCGHESLTPFVKVAMRRPVVCKIHRDLLLAPQNDPRSMRRLHDAWGMALRALFEHYTPLFIGYGGNDDTLMDLLESLESSEVKKQMIWCYHESAKPSSRIVELVTHHQGILVPVPDFDLLMVLLGEKMGISLRDEEIGLRAEARTKRYRDRIQKLDTVGHPEVTRALAATFERSGGWWAWVQKARLETEPERGEIVYRQGIQHCPDSGELLGSFAVFMGDVRGDHNEAECLHLKALKLDPKDPGLMANYAEFLLLIGRHEEAAVKLREASALSEGQPDILAGLSLIGAILAGATKKDDTHALEELRGLLSDGLRRTSWDFENVLAYAKENVAPEDHALHSALAAAILDPAELPAALALLDQRSATAKASGDGKARSPKTNGKKAAPKAAKKRPSRKKPSPKKPK